MKLPKCLSETVNCKRKRQTIQWSREKGQTRMTKHYRDLLVLEYKKNIFHGGHHERLPFGFSYIHAICTEVDSLLSILDTSLRDTLL